MGYRLANSSEPYRYATVDARDPHVRIHSFGKKAYFLQNRATVPREHYKLYLLSSSLSFPMQTRLKWRIEQLKTFTRYAIILQAFNSKGAGPKSDELIVTTMEDGKPNLST